MVKAGMHSAKTPSLARRYLSTSLKKLTPTWPVLSAVTIVKGSMGIKPRCMYTWWDITEVKWSHVKIVICVSSMRRLWICIRGASMGKLNREQLNLESKKFARTVVLHSAPCTILEDTSRGITSSHQMTWLTVGTCLSKKTTATRKCSMTTAWWSDLLWYISYI